MTTRAEALAAVDRIFDRTFGTAQFRAEDDHIIREALAQIPEPFVEWGTSEPNGNNPQATQSEEAAREWVATTYLPGQRIVIRRTVHTGPWEKEA
jgi:hypothetical protein